MFRYESEHPVLLATKHILHDIALDRKKKSDMLSFCLGRLGAEHCCSSVMVHDTPIHLS